MDKHSIYDIHKSLLREEIITNPRVMICSTRRMTIEDDFKQDKPYPKRIVRCGYVNECPICSYKQDRRLFARVLPIVKLLKENGGDIHLLTFTLRHNKSHSYRELKEVLHKSVKYIKSTYPYKKFYGVNDRLFSLHQYEDCWSPKTGFHPHAHIHLGTTGHASKEEIESRMKPKWVDVVSLFTNDKSMIPSEDYGCDLRVNRYDPFYPEEKSLERELEKLRKKSNQEDRFKDFKYDETNSKEECENYLVEQHQSIDEEKPPPIEPTLFQKMVYALKTIYKNFVNRYRIHFRTNNNHPLLQKS